MYGVASVEPVGIKLRLSPSRRKAVIPTQEESEKSICLQGRSHQPLALGVDSGGCRMIVVSDSSCLPMNSPSRIVM